MDVKVIDQDGLWFVNRSQFRMNDPESGVNFEPGMPMRVNPTKWMETQPHIEPVDDPFGNKPPMLKGEQILRENPDNVAANANKKK